MKKAGKNSVSSAALVKRSEVAPAVEAAAEKIALSVLQKFGTDGLLELWDVIFEKDGALYYLKIHVYKKRTPDGSPVTASLDSDLCERITELLNTALDAEPGSLTDRVDVLEVGSPGVTRRLRKEWHFAAVLALADKTGQISRKRVLINRKGNYMSGVLDKYEADSGVVALQSGERFALDESVVTLDYDCDFAEETELESASDLGSAPDLESAPDLGSASDLGSAPDLAEEMSETGEGELYE